MASATFSSSVGLLTDPGSISSYNRGPITSVFSVPESCTATLTLQGPGSSLYFGHFINPYVDVACYPPGTLSAQEIVSNDAWNTYYYSPAICPDGWIRATTFTSSVPAWPETNPQISLGAATTAVLCCPSEYDYISTGLGHQCQSIISENQVVEYYLPINKGADGVERGNVSTSTFAAEATVWGDGVPIWEQRTDSALLASASTITPSASSSSATTGTSPQPSSTASIPAPTTTPSSIPTSTATSTGTSNAGGLSTGAKVGIGVGIPIALIAGLLLGYLLFRRRRGKTQAYPVGGYNPKGPNAGAPGQYHNHVWQPAAHQLPPQEVYTQPENYYAMHEMPTSPQQRSPQNPQQSNDLRGGGVRYQ